MTAARCYSYVWTTFGLLRFSPPRHFRVIKGMKMLDISNEGDIKVSFKKEINFSDFYKPDQFHDVRHVVAEKSTILKKRKVRNLKLQTPVSFKYLISEDSSSKEEVKFVFDKQMYLKEKVVAAIKMQKVYRSYRIRRKLADCAVICEELWWKAKDFTALNGCITTHVESFKSKTTQEGKAVSKDDKIQKLALKQKLALRHWLEAIDPRHRYGHNLHFYYEVWFSSQSSQPFFYWLDVGDGKEVNLKICNREKLQGQRIKYLGPEERQAYEVIVEGGRLVYRQSKKPVHTNTTGGSKWIFVLSTSRILYVAEKKKGQFQHSSFLAGGATIASGRMVVNNGVLHVIWPYSGHYRPTVKNFREFICFLEEHNVDMTDVKKHPVDDDVPPPQTVDDGVSSDSSTANNQGQENVGQVATNVEASLKQNKPLSCKWTTGVGPRIGYVGEYTKAIKLQAIKQVNLPTRDNHKTSEFAGKTPIPSPRPSPKFYLSPRLANLGLPSPRIYAFPF